jgi:hypothetical protein
MTLSPVEISVLLLTGAWLQFLSMIAPVHRSDLWWSLAFALLTAGSALVLVLKDQIPWEGALLGCGGVWLLLGVVLLRDRILPRLEEGAVIVWTALLLVALHEVSGVRSAFFITVAAVAFVGIVVLLRPAKLGFATKLIMYAWCLLAAAVFTGLQIRWGSLTTAADGWSGQASPWIALIDGMAVMYCAAHAMWVWQLIPIPARSQSIADRLRDWRCDATAMVERLSDAQIHPALGIAAFALVIGSAALNEWLQWVDPWFLMRCVLIAIPVVAWVLHQIDHHRRTTPETR